MSLDATLNAQRSLQKALEGPMTSYFAQQDKMRKALEGPMASYFRGRTKMQHPSVRGCHLFDQLKHSCDAPVARIAKKRRKAVSAAASVL